MLILAPDYTNACCKIMCQVDEGDVVLELHRHGQHCYLLVDMHRPAPLEALGKMGCRDLEQSQELSQSQHMQTCSCSGVMTGVRKFVP